MLVFVLANCDKLTPLSFRNQRAKFDVLGTPALSFVPINSRLNELEFKRMKSREKVCLGVGPMPPALSDVQENGMSRELNRPPPGETGFIDERQLLARLPISRRTLGNWKAKGILPYIKIGRRCLYDWESVQGALLRRQRGGQPY